MNNIDKKHDYLQAILNSSKELVLNIKQYYGNKEINLDLFNQNFILFRISLSKCTKAKL